MIARYADDRIARNSSDLEKFKRWQEVELAVIEAREKLGRIPAGTLKQIVEIFQAHPIDVSFINAKEKELGHDLLAFIAERMQWLPIELQQYLHAEGMTSYDDEEPAFAKFLKISSACAANDTQKLLWTIRDQALKHPFTVMYRRTHGQGAELESFGHCCLDWFQDLTVALSTLEDATKRLQYSRLSGMIGTNSTIDPELEKEALALLGFIPWHGSTQIMTRVMYSPIADALANIASVVEKISGDFWLESRSGRPLMHEPFKTTQKGSSASPNKKNPITAEQNRGMGNMVRSDASCIKGTIVTPEGRDISQSCIERVKWPDIFDETLRALKNATRFIQGMRVYPDNMIIEILESRGTYAASRAKEVLTELGLPFGLSRQEAYDIVQLASFNVFAPSARCQGLRDRPPVSPEDMDAAVEFMKLEGCRYGDLPTIQNAITRASLKFTPELIFRAETVERWNSILMLMFSADKPDNMHKWNMTFIPSVIIKNEGVQFKAVFGVDIYPPKV